MKVAIVGTGTGYQDAPYDDPDWQIWTISGLYTINKPLDRVYEIHDADTIQRTSMTKEKWDFMKSNVNVCHPELQTTFPEARVIDFEGLMDKFGKYFMSSVSWMLAEAIAEGAEEIALYGVTMSADDEYAHQKPSATYLIGWARALGIKVTAQKDSELFSAPFIYGYDKFPTMFLSMAHRKQLADQKIMEAESEVFEAKAKYHEAKGYKNAIDYFEKNWWSGSRHV